jgi:VIT1/CCC1 family predicted Fe2+/Mn2+ transporter
MVGVAMASAAQGNIMLTGIAGLVAGSMSMAAGEYVSVHSQADTEKADLSRERAELKSEPAAELRELAAIYVARGLDRQLAQKVAVQLTQHDALATHARDELGIVEKLRARPLQAALASAGSFALGAALPLVVMALAPATQSIFWISGTSLLFLALLGVVAARIGGSDMISGVRRIVLWGAIAMAVTATSGVLFGAVT